MADNSKKSFIGITAHWIEVSDSNWKMNSEVIAFRAVSGSHTGENLARYFLSLCDRVGITSAIYSKVRVVSTTQTVLSDSSNQLFCVTADNASNNDATCQELSRLIWRHKLPEWNPKKQRLPYVKTSVKMQPLTIDTILAALNMLSTSVLLLSCQRSRKSAQSRTPLRFGSTTPPFPVIPCLVAH
jgi:hypothetical protein